MNKLETTLLLSPSIGGGDAEKAAPVWVDHIPKITPPLPIDDDMRRADIYWLKLSARRMSPRLPVEMLRFGETEMRRKGLAPPPAKPNPRNPSGLFLCAGSGTAFDIAVYPTYPRTGP